MIKMWAFIGQANMAPDIKLQNLTLLQEEQLQNPALQSPRL